MGCPARGNAVTIFDCRPPWHSNLTEWSKLEVAKLRYSASAGACTGPTAMVAGTVMTVSSLALSMRCSTRSTAIQSASSGDSTAGGGQQMPQLRSDACRALSVLLSGPSAKP